IAGSTLIPGRLPAARLKPASTASPSITSTLPVQPSLSNTPLSALVLASLSSRLSTTIRPSLALAESAILRPSARTFLLSDCSNSRRRAPWALPPPMKIGARRSPWRAVPPPFWRPHFLPVRATSERSRVGRAVPRRFSSCHVTTRCRMSARGSTPNTASLSSMSPAALPSSCWTFTFTGSALLAFAFGRIVLGGVVLFGHFGVGGSAGVLLGEQRSGFLFGRAGVDRMLGGGLDHAGRRFFMLGS